jgi:subtilisin-like proprotein convertase family protein
MKNKIIRFISISVLLFSSASIFSQLAYSPVIDSVINLSTIESMSLLDREISGDTSTMIGGTPYTITSRYYNNPSNDKAGQYIYEKFLSYGLNARYMNFRPASNGINVIGTKLGSKYPGRQYIICAHYDDMPSSGLAPGADDNGSGTCAVIEAARLLSPLTFDYTLVFIAFDQEELGLYGSKAYADTAFYMNHDTILGVINLDMIAWDSNNDYQLSIHVNNNSMSFADNIISVYNIYQPQLVPSKTTSMSGGSDHQSFWNRGYKAILAIESISDFNTHYHTSNDKFQYVNVPFFSSMTKAAIAALMSFAWDFRINFNHVPLVSSNDTTDREAVVTIDSPQPIVTSGANAPRLYYKVNNEMLNYLNSSYVNLDTFKFIIPGQPLGNVVSYYFAAQDSLGRFVGTLPAGGRGTNPPGTISPVNFFTYQVTEIDTYTVCSTTLPKPILDNSTTYDTINVFQPGNIVDLNVNLTIYHTWDGDLSISLKGPNQAEIDLSSHNGGSGDNYYNTTFDDEAAIPITSGSPPFTGSYRPEQPLSTFDYLPLAGSWVLEVNDNAAGDTGQLASWCLIFQRGLVIGANNNEQQPVQYELSQNYPNPFNSSTKINFNIAKQSDVKIMLYDILGREVKLLVDSKLERGKYDIYMNANNLASGVYFYTMYINGEFFNSKKMVMIK